MKTILYGRSGKWVRRVALLLLDLGLVFIAAYISLLLRFDGINRAQYGYLVQCMPAIMAIYAAYSLLSGVYDIIWRYAAAPELFRLAAAYAVAGIATLVVENLLHWHISRPVLVLTPIILLFMVIASRLAWRWLRELVRRNGIRRKARILIVGAGEGGA